MAKLIDRLPMLLELRKENWPLIRANAADPDKDRDGSCTNMMALHCRFLAVADYFLHQNVESFRLQLSEAAQLRSNLFSRYEAGDPIDDSYVSMLSYKSLFDALATDNWELARKLALQIGGRDELEKKYDHPFDRAMGYTLKAFVLGEESQMQLWLPKLELKTSGTKTKHFQGYPRVFQGIFDSDSEAVNAGLEQVVQGHQKMSTRNGLFANSEDELVCIWGVGLANLAIHNQIPVKPIPPLIPADLLTSV